MPLNVRHEFHKLVSFIIREIRVLNSILYFYL
jgi:hypothetical protein